MSNWQSAAVNAAANGLAEYSEEMDLERQVPEAAGLLKQARLSTDKLFLSHLLLDVARSHPTPQHFRTWLATLAATDIGREYLAIGFAWDGLNRTEEAVSRLLQLLSVLPSADPPKRSMERLQAAASMYVSGFDTGSIAMCRAVVEVLVEEFAAPEEVSGNLAATIVRFRDRGTSDRRKLTSRQAADLFFINDQAKEVLHDEPAPKPLDPLGCLERLARLLAELHQPGIAR